MPLSRLPEYVAGYVKRIDAVDLGLHRPGEDLAVGEVLLAVARDPGPPRDAEREIGAVADDPDRLPLAQPGPELRIPRPESRPVRDGIVVVEEPGPVDEVLVLPQGHVRLLGGPVAWGRR